MLEFGHVEGMLKHEESCMCQLVLGEVMSGEIPPAHGSGNMLLLTLGQGIYISASGKYQRQTIITVRAWEGDEPFLERIEHALGLANARHQGGHPMFIAHRVRRSAQDETREGDGVT